MKNTEENMKVQILNIILWIGIILIGLWLIGSISSSIHTGEFCNGMTQTECEAYSDIMGSNPDFR